MIYKSQEPLRILGDLSDDVSVIVRRVDTNDDIEAHSFARLKRLKKPLQAGDICYLYAQSYFKVRCVKKNDVSWCSDDECEDVIK